MQGKLSGTEEEARRKMEEVRVQDKDYRGAGKGGEKLVIEMEESRPGVIAEAVRAVDQVKNQTFNDAGRFDEEGVIRVEKRREKM